MRLLDPMKLQLLHRDDVIDRATLDRMMNALEPGLARQLRMGLLTLSFAVTGIAVLVALAWLISDAAGRKDLLQTFVGVPGIWVAVLAGAIVPVLAARSKHAARVPAMLLSYRRCPHCGYDLHGLRADETDGATVCPECACAWDLSETALNVEAHAAAPAATSPLAIKLGLAAGLLLFTLLLGVFFARSTGAGAGPSGGHWLILGTVVAVGVTVAGLAVWLNRKP